MTQFSAAVTKSERFHLYAFLLGFLAVRGGVSIGFIAFDILTECIWS